MNPFYNESDAERMGGETAPRDHRTPFQIDRDRVVFSFAFRRLQSKTQVFKSGEYDFYRTRLTHSLETAQIARSICHYLNTTTELPGKGAAIDGDLVEAIGLSHDLGHPPFGHMGERKLNQLMHDYGGFEGNAQTLRILTHLIWERPRQGPEGMKPSRAFTDGVMKYKALFSRCCAEAGKAPENHFLYEDQREIRDFIFYDQSPPHTLASADALNKFRSIECQIVDWADDTAYCMHDIVDGVKAGFLTTRRIERWAEKQSPEIARSSVLAKLLERLREERLEQSFGKRVGTYISTCKLVPRNGFLSDKSQRHAWSLTLDPEVRAEADFYKKLALDLIFRSPLLQQLEYKGGMILDRLFTALSEQYLDKHPRPLNILPEAVDWSINTVPEDNRQRRARLLCDFLAGCTDNFAMRLYKRLFEPDYGSITDLT